MTDDARITLDNAMAAHAHGAQVVTRARVTGVEHARADDRPCDVELTDLLSGRSHHVEAHGVVNCTGAWTDTVRRLAEVEPTVIRPTKGVHLVVQEERLGIHRANVLTTPQDGRVFFVTPGRAARPSAPPTPTTRVTRATSASPRTTSPTCSRRRSAPCRPGPGGSTAIATPPREPWPPTPTCRPT